MLLVFSWKKTWKRKEISLPLLLSFLNPKISFLLGKGAGRGDVCAEPDVTQEGSREQTWQRVGQKRQFQCDVIIESPLEALLIILSQTN